MKRGQTTVEFVFLVGLVAAGLIAMLVYVGRGHQGNLRSQAEQLGAQQYEPGNTTVNNWESKNVTKTEAMISGSTTKHSDAPQGEDNPDAQSAYVGIEGKMAELYNKMYEIDKKFKEEGIAKAVAVAAGEWPWVAPAGLADLLKEYYAIQTELNSLYKAAADAKMPPRKKNQSTSGAESMERGTIITEKSMDETLGDL